MRESKNNLSIIGTLKSKEVKYGTSNGVSTISLDLVIESKFEDKIHENKVKLWAKETSKLYKGYVTVANEYKTSIEHGDAADRVKIDGSLEMNEYVNRDGELRTFNNLRGVFINRIDKPEIKDEVGAIVECVVLGYSDEISKEGLPTGRKKVNLFTVGYNNSISELQNVFVNADVAQQFTKLYQPNTTGELFIKVNNYVEVTEKQPEQQQQIQTLGFGATLDNMPSENNVIKNYVNDLVIIGGNMPKVADKYTMEEIQEMKKLRELSKQEKIKVSTQPPVQQSTGFGVGFDSAAIDKAIDDFEDPFA